MRRRDGSIQSSNLPAAGKLAQNEVAKDYSIYRCMVTEVFYTDDQQNLTFDNKQVTYEAIILGGRKEGQVITNIKNVNQFGGQYNYHERIYRKSVSPFSGEGKKGLPEQTGDIIYVGFIAGNTSLPIIIGCGTSPLDKTTTGATKDQGPIWKQEFNGVFEEITKDGEYRFIRKGGTYADDKGYFVPADRATEEENGQAAEEEFQFKLEMLADKVVAADPKSTVTLDKVNEKMSFEIGENKVTFNLDGKQKSITIDASNGNSILIDQSGEISINAKSKVSINAPLVDVGEGAAYSCTIFENLLSEFAKHTHNAPQAPSGVLPTTPPLAPLMSLVGSQSVKIKD